MLRRSSVGTLVLTLALASAPAGHGSREAAGWTDHRGPQRAKAERPASPGHARAVECYGRRATIVGSHGPDVLTGTPGNDVIAGRRGNDVIDGRGGDDFICPGRGNDVAAGGDGDDNLDASPGDDVLDGGAGRDFLGYFYSSRAAVVDFSTGEAAGRGLDLVRGFEGAVGSRFGDTFLGGPAAEQLEGRGGNDHRDGGEGDDLLMPGPGLDRVAGGDGWDFALYWDAPRGIWADLRGAQGNGRDRLDGIEGLAGSDFADVLTGDEGHNALYGYRGRDRLRGRGGDDRLFGGRGPDLLDGGPGTDLLDGGAGRDRCVHGEELRRCR